MKVIAYDYDADHHCESCMLDYARNVEYKDYVWGEFNTDDDISNGGLIDLMKAVELEIIRDSEGNAIHPLFSTSEWWQEGEGNQTLACSDCGKELDTYVED